jgi:predicted component of type VI protein secretion system
MAYIIFTANGEEYDRRELTDAVTLGRAPDCDITIPDITLSRRHCRIEPSENGRGWQITDLQSKNGTHFRGRKVEQHVLRADDEIRIGRTRLTFCAEAFVPAPAGVRRRGVIRPADPTEALAGTVTGMVLCEPDEVEHYEGMPCPKPRPADPTAYVSEDVYGMIDQIASSSWDSIMAQNSQPVRMQRAAPVPAVTRAHRGAIRPRPRVAFYLQAEHRRDPGAPAVAAAEAAPPPARPMAAMRRLPRRASRWMSIFGGVTGTATFIFVWVSLVLSASKPESGGSSTPAAARGASWVEPAVVEPTPQRAEPILWDSVTRSA